MNNNDKENVLTPDELIAELINRGGYITTSNCFTPQQILEARKDNRFAVIGDGEHCSIGLVLSLSTDLPEMRLDVWES